MEEGARGGEADSGSGDWSGCRLQLTLAYGLQIGAGAALLQAWRGLKLDASFMLQPECFGWKQPQDASNLERGGWGSGRGWGGHSRRPYGFP